MEVDIAVGVRTQRIGRGRGSGPAKNHACYGTARCSGSLLHGTCATISAQRDAGHNGPRLAQRQCVCLVYSHLEQP